MFSPTTVNTFPWCSVFQLWYRYMRCLFNAVILQQQQQSAGLSHKVNIRLSLLTFLDGNCSVHLSICPSLLHQCNRQKLKRTSAGAARGSFFLIASKVLNPSGRLPARCSCLPLYHISLSCVGFAGHMPVFLTVFTSVTSLVHLQFVESQWRL